MFHLTSRITFLTIRLSNHRQRKQTRSDSSHSKDKMSYNRSLYKMFQVILMLQLSNTSTSYYSRQKTRETTSCCCQERNAFGKSSPTDKVQGLMTRGTTFSDRCTWSIGLKACLQSITNDQSTRGMSLSTLVISCSNKIRACSSTWLGLRSPLDKSDWIQIN